nr:BMS1-like protein [Cryptomonas paramecium]
MKMFSKGKDPVFISILGPRRVGKTTLSTSLIFYYSFLNHYKINGPFCILNNQKNSYLFREIPCDKLSMINSIKTSDIIILLVDCYFGLELETFEMLSLLNSYGCVRILCVLTHLDLFSNWKTLKKAKIRIKKKLKFETSTELKLIYFQGITINEKYLSREISNLSRYFFKKSCLPSLHDNLNCAIIFSIKIYKKNFEKALFIGYNRGKSFKKINNVFFYIPGMGKLEIQKINSNSLKKSKNYNKFNLEKKIYYNLKKIVFSEKKIWEKRRFLFFLTCMSNCRQVKKIFISDNFVPIDSVKFCLFKEKKIYIDFNPPLGTNSSTNVKTSGSIICKLTKKKQTEDTNTRKIVIIELKLFPLKFKKYFDPCYPILIIADPLYSTKKIFIEGTVNRYKWNKISPISRSFYLICIGWRIFKTLVFFFKKNSNGFRMYKKNLKSGFYKMTCSCYHFSVKCGTAIIGILCDEIENRTKYQGRLFGISFSGSVTSTNKKINLFKKIKLTGYIFRSSKRIGFVKNVFNTNIQVYKFIGSVIYTIRGIKGFIKDYISCGSNGSFRAVFEKKIMTGETVFFRIWFPVKTIGIFQDISFLNEASDFREVLKKKVFEYTYF